MELPVRGSDVAFPDCPAYYLRTGADIPAEHLSGGAHPAHIVGPALEEIEAGGARYSDYPPKVAEGVRLMRLERSHRQQWEHEQRMKESNRGRHG